MTNRTSVLAVLSVPFAAAFGVVLVTALAEAEHNPITPSEVPAARVQMTAYRPQTRYFVSRPVSDWDEVTPVAGIRVNESGSSLTSYWIQVDLYITPWPAPDGVDFLLRKNGAGTFVRDANGLIVLVADAETAVTFADQRYKRIYVENRLGGPADLDLIARRGTEQQSLDEDRVHFYPFTSVVIVVGGRNQQPSDPADPNYGIFRLAIQLYTTGYDVHMYHEDTVSSDGSGPAYDQVVRAVRRRKVGQVAILGYSHGGGSTHDLAERLDADRDSLQRAFDISFTAYVDAVRHSREFNMFREQRRPPGTAYHVNYY